MRRVVAGIDGSERSLAAAEWAAREAASRGLPLAVLHVSPPVRWVLDRAVSQLAGRHPRLEVTGEQIDGPVADTLLDAAEGTAELLVVGTRGLGGFRGLLVGSVALEAAARSASPVALVPEHSPARGEHPPEVVVGVDARHPALGALGFAFDAAQRREARLRAVHAWSLPGSFGSPWAPYAPTEEDRGAWEDQEVQLLSDALRGWRQKYPAAATVPDVRLFAPAKALVSASAGADLLVTGRPGFALRGVPHAAAHHAHCPIVLVPER
jgi:nucleotide-binding universal stress UspA family protein